MLHTKLFRAVIAVALVFICSCSPFRYDMVLVDGGEFVVGSCDADADADESPMRIIGVRSFYLSAYEVTQEQWRAVMRDDPSFFSGDDRPVESVSWFEVQEFISKLNERTGRSYRLPTELEWEYAARGGKYNKPFRYSGSDDYRKVAWNKDTSTTGTFDVGELKPNILGLYDMTGNVHEWCSNCYDSTLYASKNLAVVVTQEPTGEITVKGGSWLSDTTHLRIANRNHVSPHTKNVSLGFRLAMDVER